MNIKIVFVIFILSGSTNMKITWRLELGVASGGYKMPPGLSKDDYTPMKILQEVANEVIANHNKLLEVKEKLEANTSWDTIVRIAGSVCLVGGTVIGFLLKIRGIKKNVQNSMIQGVGGQQVALRPFAGSF